MEEIKIKGKCFNYEPEQLSYETSVVIDKDIARENLLLFKKIADRNNFNFLIFYGTLLGAIREHDFISHDIDIDVVTNDEDKLLEIIPELINNGFKFIRYESSPSLKSYTTLYSFRRSSVYIDVYIAYKEKNKYNLLNCYIKKSFIENKMQYEFLDEKFTIPKEYIKILKLLYGKDWKIPQKNKPGDFKPRRNIIYYLKRVYRRFFKKKYWLQIFTTGYISNPTLLFLIYNCLDVFVCPSIIENLPYTILESICSGTPVTAFKAGGNPDIIEHKYNGYLATPYDSSDLARRIDYCIENKSILSKNVW